MIQSHLGHVKMSTLDDETIKRCEQLGIDTNELLQTTRFADLHCIFHALADEYGLEELLQEVTKNCELLIKERTNNGNTNNML